MSFECSEWDRGVLSQSSWHGQETIGVMPDAAAMNAAGEASGAWPIKLTLESLTTSSGLVCPSHAIRADYAQHPPRCFRAVSSDYTPNPVAERRAMIEAVVAAGGKPTGAFALRDGARTVATFEVSGNGLRNNIVIADSYDGSLSYTCGEVVTRVVCANTLRVAMREGGLARIRHTRSLEERVAILRENVGKAIESGQTFAKVFETATDMTLRRESYKKAFDMLFPTAEADATEATKTKAENARREAAAAAFHPLNRAGDLYSLGTLWNAATWLVDRTPEGKARPMRSGGDALESMLFGGRAQRVTEIQKCVEAVMNDGTIERMTVSEARAAGIDARQIGKSIIADAIGDA